MRRAWSGRSSSGTMGMVAYNYTRVDVRTSTCFPRYGTLLLTTDAIGMLQRFIGQIIQDPAGRFDPTIPGLPIALGGWIRDLEEGIIRCEGGTEFNLLHPDRTFVKSA